MLEWLKWLRWLKWLKWLKWLNLPGQLIESPRSDAADDVPIQGETLQVVQASETSRVLESQKRLFPFLTWRELCWHWISCSRKEVWNNRETSRPDIGHILYCTRTANQSPEADTLHPEDQSGARQDRGESGKSLARLSSSQVFNVIQTEFSAQIQTSCLMLTDCWVVECFAQINSLSVCLPVSSLSGTRKIINQVGRLSCHNNFKNQDRDPRFIMNMLILISQRDTPGNYFYSEPVSL